MTIVYVAVSLLPVGFFLAALMLLDSYKLVRARSVFLTLVIGGLAAGASYFVNNWVFEVSGITSGTLRLYTAPFIEEFLKALFVGYIVASNRVGFTVDAAIQGFAVGAGFAVVENIFWLTTHDLSLRIWMLRGLGTAIMHGATMTVFAILAKSLRDRHKGKQIVTYGAAFLVAFVLHSAYNHVPFGRPEIGTAFQILVFPLIIMILFQESEKRTRSWLGTGFDTDQELLRLIISGGISDTHIGGYLSGLKKRFEGPVVVDMLCLIRIRVELSVRAKGILMMRKAGFKVNPDPSTKSKFVEMKFLESSIGRTGLIAIEPVHKWTRRDLWQLNMLDVAGSGVNPGLLSSKGR